MKSNFLSHTYDTHTHTHTHTYARTHAYKDSIKQYFFALNVNLSHDKFFNAKRRMWKLSSANIISEEMWFKNKCEKIRIFHISSYSRNVVHLQSHVLQRDRALFMLEWQTVSDLDLWLLHSPWPTLLWPWRFSAELDIMTSALIIANRYLPPNLIWDMQ